MGVGALSPLNNQNKSCNAQVFLSETLGHTIFVFTPKLGLSLTKHF